MATRNEQTKYKGDFFRWAIYLIGAMSGGL